MSIEELELNSKYFCPCCGSSDFSNDEISCKQCLTPQHLDCWNYFGRCSVFGCGSIEYVINYQKIEFVEKIEPIDRDNSILGVLLGLSVILFVVYCCFNFIF